MIDQNQVQQSDRQMQQQNENEWTSLRYEGDPDYLKIIIDETAQSQFNIYIPLSQDVPNQQQIKGMAQHSNLYARLIQTRQLEKEGYLERLNLEIDHLPLDQKKLRRQQGLARLM